MCVTYQFHFLVIGLMDFYKRVGRPPENKPGYKLQPVTVDAPLLAGTGSDIYIFNDNGHLHVFFSPVTNEIIDYSGSGADASLCVKPPLSLSVNILPTTLSDWLRNMLITLSSIHSTPLFTLLFLFPYLYLFCSVITAFCFCCRLLCSGCWHKCKWGYATNVFAVK